MRVQRNNVSNGMGELIPGSYVVPQNPITAVTKMAASQPGESAIVPGVGMVKRIPTIGELIAGSWVVPENPIRQAQYDRVGMGNAIVKNLGMGSCGCDAKSKPLAGKGACGCGKGHAYAYGKDGGLTGLGDLTFDSVFQTLGQQYLGIPLYVLLGLGITVVSLMSSRGVDYTYQKEQLRKQYATRSRRWRKAIGGAAEKAAYS